MKKVLCILLVTLSLFFTGCETLKGTDALIEKAREVIPVAEADTVEIRYAGLNAKGDSSLHWFISGNEYQSHYYLPMVCTVVGKNEYRFERVHKPLERGTDIVVFQWQGGYSFLVNNERCKAIRITDHSGTKNVNIKDDSYPFVYYNDTIPSEYVFLDADGEKMH